MSERLQAYVKDVRRMVDASSLRARAVMAATRAATQLRHSLRLLPSMYCADVRMQPTTSRLVAPNNATHPQRS